MTTDTGAGSQTTLLAVWRDLADQIGRPGLPLAITVMIATLIAAVIFVPGDAGRDSGVASSEPTIVHPCEARPCRCAYCGG